MLAIPSSSHTRWYDYLKSKKAESTFIHPNSVLLKTEVFGCAQLSQKRGTMRHCFGWFEARVGRPPLTWATCSGWNGRYPPGWPERYQEKWTQGTVHCNSGGDCALILLTYEQLRIILLRHQNFKHSQAGAMISLKLVIVKARQVWFDQEAKWQSLRDKKSNLTSADANFLYSWSK